MASYAGNAIIATGGPSGFGTTAPIAILHVVGGNSATSTLDTTSPILAYANTSIACKKGAIRGIYNYNSFYGAGVVGVGYGWIPMPSTIDVGVFGSSNGFGVVGLLGTNGSTLTAGVYGKTEKLGAAGIRGDANTSTSNYAAYFYGNVSVTGSLSKGSGTFKIDHPLDPENKYLYHSFVESPDMMNIYNGNITTDANGFATVIMPTYFDALNKDFRYQLTVMGTFAQAIISEEINGMQFIIQTDKPNVKVSWQVTGVRKDNYAEQNRVIVEVEKETENKGKYLHPAAFNQPESKAIGRIELDNSNKPNTRDGKPEVTETQPQTAQPIQAGVVNETKK